MGSIIAGLIFALGAITPYYLCTACEELSLGKYDKAKDRFIRALIYVSGCVATASSGCLFAALFHNAG